MAKSRGADAPTTEEKEASTEAFLNLGIDVKLRTKTVKVKELSFNELLAILAKSAMVFSGLSETSGDGSDFLIHLARKPEAQDLIREIFAASTGEPPAFFVELPAADGLRLIGAINQVNDFVEIFSVFQEMGLQKIVSAFMEQKSQKS